VIGGDLLICVNPSPLPRQPQYGELKMAHSLNLTLKIKQDAETLTKLKHFKENFASLQDRIAAAMKESKILHFARVVVIEDKYVQVLTEYDGDRKAYTEFFRKKLPDIFKLVFSLAEDAPTTDDLDDPDLFFSFSKDKDIRPLGKSLSDDPDDHFVFSAYGNLTVEQILASLGDKAPK
jgi:hypothetical protein